MRVFIAGATGAIGTPLVRQLVDRGHEVIGTSRSRERAERLHEFGAEPITLDVLDRDSVRSAVLDAKPDVIVHQATALTGLSDFKHFDRSFAQTNRLRTEGTDALLAAAREAGVRRFVAQSYACHRYARQGGRQDRRGSARPRAGVEHARDGGGDEPPRPGGHRGRWDRLALWQLLRRSRRRVRPRGARAEVPDRRRRRRGLVVHPPRGRRRRDGPSRSSGTVRPSTTSWTTSRLPRPSGCRSWRGWSEREHRNGSPVSWPGSSRARPPS